MTTTKKPFNRNLRKISAHVELSLAKVYIEDNYIYYVFKGGNTLSFQISEDRADKLIRAQMFQP